MSVKMVCMGLVFSGCLAGCASTGEHPSPAESAAQGRIAVPGGLKKAESEKLWKVAKSKCYEFGYVVANDDKETGNILCTKNTSMGNYIIQINFDSEGFLVTTQGVLAGVGFLEKLDPVTKKRKTDMENALKQVAGVKN